MKHKRHIVLAALVLALGTAVYINWRYGAENIHPASASTAASGTVSSARLGDVLYVNGGVASSDGSAEASAVPSAQFTEAALSRQKARDEATALLKATLTAAESSEETRKAAVAQAVGTYFSGGLLGKPVLLAELGRRIYDVEGVENYHLLAPTEDLEQSASVLPVLGNLSVKLMGED